MFAASFWYSRLNNAAGRNPESSGAMTAGLTLIPATSKSMSVPQTQLWIVSEEESMSNARRSERFSLRPLRDLGALCGLRFCFSRVREQILNRKVRKEIPQRLG